MVISLCGNEKNKKALINILKKVYEDNVIVCNIFNIKFNIVIETESIKYKLLDNCISLESARKEYQKIVEEKTNEIINKLINNEKDKIVLLVDNDILTKVFTNSVLFYSSDIKILFEDIIEDVNYDKNKFDYVINNVNDIDVRKLVKK